MEPFLDPLTDRGDAELARQQSSPPDNRFDGPTHRTTRRLLLVLGGLLTGGWATRAAVGDTPPSSSSQARLKLAQAAMETVRVNIGRGRFTPGERDPISIWSRRRMEARIDLSTTRADRVAAAQEHLDEMKAVEQLVAQMFKTGEIDRLVQMDAEYRRLEAESWLEREKAKT